MAVIKVDVLEARRPRKYASAVKHCGVTRRPGVGKASRVAHGFLRGGKGKTRGFLLIFRYFQKFYQGHASSVKQQNWLPIKILKKYLNMFSSFLE